MKILYIVGNRPQFIKLAVLHQEARKHSEIEEYVLHTGQHFSKEMSDIFFEELGIELPIINLNIRSLPHAAMIGQMMVVLEPEMEKNQPDIVIVFGDTNTTLAGALTAKKLNIPLVHIEAGIRTFEESMPEESNRYLTDRMASVNFCCTQSGMENLKNEGFETSQINSRIVFSGDLMLDVYNKFYNQFHSRNEIINNLKLNKGGYILFTLHRKQNLQQPGILREIIEALDAINKQIPIVCPMHPNTKKLLGENNIEYKFLSVPPLGYLDMQALLLHCKYVITDSGGLQREAFFAKKPSLVLMDKPFWPEVMEFGPSLNSTSQKEEIISSFKRLQTLQKDFEFNPFGEGNAAEIIINYLLNSNSSDK